MALLHSMFYFFFLYQSSLSWCTVIPDIWYNIERFSQTHLLMYLSWSTLTSVISTVYLFLYLFIYSDPSTFSVVVFPPLWDDGRISLNSVFLLLLLLNFVRGYMLKLMYVSFVINIRVSFIHLHGFQLLMLLH